MIPGGFKVAKTLGSHLSRPGFGGSIPPRHPRPRCSEWYNPEHENGHAQEEGMKA